MVRGWGLRGSTGVGVLACALICLSSAPAAAQTVEAGTLRASVQADPWRLEFSDPKGASVLREVAGGGAGPTGALGFKTGEAWFHATRVQSGSQDGNSYSALLATDDPLGRTIAVRISPRAEGVIDVSASVRGVATGLVTSTGVAFSARGGERYLGFGERSNAVDQRGNEVRNYVSEGPYQEAEYPALAAFVPGPGYNTRRDATYYPVPWLLSTAGYGVLVGNDEESRFRLGSSDADAWSVEADSASLTYSVFAGPRPTDALRRMTALTGRQPPPAAPWFFGPWFQPSEGDEAAIETLRAADAPASVGQTYLHYLPCGDQQGIEADQPDRTALYHRAGLAVTTYFNPMICNDYSPVYERAVAAGVLNTDSTGQPYLYRYTGSTVFLVGQFDFTNPAAVDFYGNLLREATDDGYDGWMEDFGEYTPLDARAYDGSTGTALHNKYVTLYHRAGYEFSRSAGKPLARFNRSGWTGTAQHSQITWGGDPTTDFGFDGLASSITNGLTMGASGVSMWGSDIGGFFALSKRQTTPELLVRWLEFGFASGVMRTQANGFDLTPMDRAQIFDPEILPIWRRYAKLRTQLYPYLASAQRTYNRNGLPMMRSLALIYPGDAQAAAREDQYLFGRDLLVAPVVNRGQTRRELYLPRGRWIDLWRSATYLERDGSLRLGRARSYRGRRSVTVPAPLEELPTFVRAGAVLPMLPADVDTLTSYGAGREIVNLRDRRRQMTLLAFPRGKTRREIGKGERVVSRERRGSWTLRVAGKVRRRYRLQASMSTLRRPFAPCQVELNGKPLSRKAWSYSRKSRTLRVAFKARRGTVTARRSCR